MLSLIGPQDEITKLYIKSLSEELNLIHFDIEPSLESTYSFNLFPSLDILCHGFAELVKRFEWKHLAIIYDSKTSNFTLKEQVFCFTSQKLQVTKFSEAFVTKTFL